MIQASGLQKRFGARAVLQGLDLEVTPGAVTLLVGANGAGKTTLLRILSGLARPDRGSVRIAGIDLLAQRETALAALSFLSQAPRFHPRLTALDVAKYYAQIRGRSLAEAHRALSSWGLDDHLKTPTSQLSGGLRQRLAIALFSLARAPVLLLDEPGLSLDPEWRLRLQSHLSDEARGGATVIVATHLLGEWEGRTDACVLLEGGRVQRWLDPEKLREYFFSGDRVPSS